MLNYMFYVIKSGIFKEILFFYKLMAPTNKVIVRPVPTLLCTGLGLDADRLNAYRLRACRQPVLSGGCRLCREWFSIHSFPLCRCWQHHENSRLVSETGR
jgi:hypothetical protein